MGSDIANIKAGKSSNSNLKVPPLKIVLSSHQNNSAIVNSNTNDDEQTGLHDKDYKVDNDEEVCSKQPSRKNSRSERKASDSGHSASKTNTNSSNYSSSSNSSDRSSSTSPSSESESLDSNLTIISENNQAKAKTEHKEDTPKQERNSRHSGKSLASSNVSATGARRSQDNVSSADTNSDLAASSSSGPISSANQRITRSSQRAAQQNKTENSSETNGDDSNVAESQDKVVESARKVKRRKVEPQESELESSQAAQQTVTMANICPADYQPPSQNSFELYRDIRERPYKKMSQLNHIQPRMPYGFKDYLLNSGPYLLDGNRLGSGLNGSIDSSVGNHGLYATINRNNTLASRYQLQMKLSNLHRKSPSTQASQQRHSAYVIPKYLEAPKSIRVGSPLYKLFQDQEKARHQMRMQHLKERERSVLTTEQEILRVYNRMAIADNRQELHLSACTYFYYQERYHYLDETADSKKKVKEASAEQDKKNNDADQLNVPSKTLQVGNIKQADMLKEGIARESGIRKEKDQHTIDSLTGDKKVDEQKNGVVIGTIDVQVDQIASEVPKPNSSDSSQAETKSKETPDDQDSVKKLVAEVESIVDKHENPSVESKNFDGSISDRAKASANCDEVNISTQMSDEDLKSLNKSVFLDQLQKIDDKWAKIMGEMFIRHKNESDSLYAVQSLEWEWKAKEIGVCDVRVTPKIEPDCVPRVEVSELDY